MKFISVALAALVWLSVSGSAAAEPPSTIRIGHFANITHAHGVIANQLSFENSGWFEARLKVPVSWSVYNAGPSAMEALLSGSIDATYVGPNPAINAFLRSSKKRLRVIAGAVRGGSALVVQSGRGLRSPDSFRGLKIATPQLGNTQDVAARAWFKDGGLNVTLTGGDVNIVPVENPEQLPLFKAKTIDGAWTVEPWVSRLEDEGGGELVVNEPDAVTTILVVSEEFAQKSPELVAALVKAHSDLGDWIKANPARAQAKFNSGLARIMGRPMPETLLTSSWSRISFSDSITDGDLSVFLDRAQRVGLLKNAGSVSGIVWRPE